MGNQGWEGLKCCDCPAMPIAGQRRCVEHAEVHRLRENERGRKATSARKLKAALRRDLYWKRKGGRHAEVAQWVVHRGAGL